MLERAAISAIAVRLHQAERLRRPTRQLTLDYPHITIDDAYAIQQAWIRIHLAAGRAIKGRKIGLTSHAMQSALGISEPDYGVLLDNMFYGNGADIPFQRFIAPKVEVELAFVLSRELRGPGCSTADVLAATDHVTPMLEIIDTRVQRIDPETRVNKKIQDNIADNAGCGAMVESGIRLAPDGRDLRWIAALLHRNGKLEESGVSAAVLDHPANGIAWLANALARHGTGLPAGEIILSGSFTRPVDVNRGDAIRVEYGGIGEISCRFT
jgi:2-oxo-hept-3-ene-1,7-dioate hydratase